jgi:hypothetical protein
MPPARIMPAALADPNVGKRIAACWACASCWVNTAWVAGSSGTNFFNSDCSVALPATVLLKVLEFSPGTWTVVAWASAPVEVTLPAARAAGGADLAVVVAKSPMSVTTTTPRGTNEPITEVPDVHVPPREGRSASRTPTRTARIDSARPMPTVATETPCGPSTPSQSAPIATFAAATTPNNAREGLARTVTVNATCASAATIPAVARAPWR